MSALDASDNLPAPRRITASNLSLPSNQANDEHAEPGVEVRDDKLVVEPLMDGSYRRAVIATSTQVPTKNDGHGQIPLDAVPGAGIVMPGGLNAYYLDIAPNTEGPLHRTTSTDYVIVISGKLSLITPSTEAYQIKDGKATYTGDLVETIGLPGDVIYQRGPIHSLSNRTNEWVRALCIVVGSETNKASTDETDSHKELTDQWLA